MEKKLLGFQNIEKPLYYQKNIRKISNKKKSIDTKSIKSKYNKYANGTNLNINENIINDFEDNNLINPEQEQINKLKLENEKLKSIL